MKVQRDEILEKVKGNPTNIVINMIMNSEYLLQKVLDGDIDNAILEAQVESGVHLSDIQLMLVINLFKEIHFKEDQNA